MVPQALILTAGLVAMVAAPAAANEPGYVVSHTPACLASARPVSPGTGAEPALEAPRASQLPGRALRSAGFALGSASTAAVLTLWAAAMVLIGAIPMALAVLLRYG